MEQIPFQPLDNRYFVPFSKSQPVFIGDINYYLKFNNLNLKIASGTPYWNVNYNAPNLNAS